MVGFIDFILLSSTNDDEIASGCMPPGVGARKAQATNRPCYTSFHINITQKINVWRRLVFCNFMVSLRVFMLYALSAMLCSMLESIKLPWIIINEGSWNGNGSDVDWVMDGALHIHILHSCLISIMLNELFI